MPHISIGFWRICWQLSKLFRMVRKWSILKGELLSGQIWFIWSTPRQNVSKAPVVYGTFPVFTKMLHISIGFWRSVEIFQNFSGLFENYPFKGKVLSMAATAPWTPNDLRCSKPACNMSLRCPRVYALNKLVSTPLETLLAHSAKLQDQQSWPVSVLQPSPASLKGHLILGYFHAIDFR